MHVSLCGLEVDAMERATIFNIWRNMQDQIKFMLKLIIFFLGYKSRLYYDYSNILVFQKEGTQ